MKINYFRSAVEQSEQEEISRKMLEGEYYKDARDWYGALYIAPVAERSAFLVIAVLAGLIVFIGSLSLLDLMPISEKTRIIVPSNSMDSSTASLHRLKEPGKPINLALKKFFATGYVYTRESYRYNDFERSQAFVRAHSDPTTLSAYMAEHGADNPKSYAALLGRVGERTVQITGVKVDSKVEPYTATVTYVTDFKKVRGGVQTAWTATLSFYYTNVSVNEVPDPATGEIKFDIEDPAFNVVSYSVAQNR